MTILRMIAASTLMIAAVNVARADTTCQSVRADLTGPNVFGSHTIGQLSESTRAGNCDDAAYLVRRAKDAKGFVETNCPSDADLRSLAANMVKLGQDTLASPTCKD